LLWSKARSGIAEQVACRKAKKIFLDCKVFNTSVDKFVEIVVRLAANFSRFNTLLLFAQFLCNKSFNPAQSCFTVNLPHGLQSLEQKNPQMKEKQRLGSVFYIQLSTANFLFNTTSGVFRDEP
jgi:hypothetical protein